MSILNAIKQQGSSIDDLSKLPQSMIMTMAQKNQIPSEMVAPILARKAEMADAVARTRTLQSAGGAMPSVMEQLMQKNAEGEQPERQAREMCVAQLPMKEDMYAEHRMAGGGIVAFNGETGSQVEAPPREAGESENDYMKRVAMVSELGGQFFNPRNYDPIAKLKDLYGAYDRNIGQPFAEGVKRFTSDDGTAGFNAATNARKNVSFTDTAPNTKTINSTPSQAEIDKIRATNKSPAATPAEPGVKSLVQKPVADTKAQSPLQKATDAPEMKGAEPKVDPIDAMLAKYEKMIAGDPETATKAKKEAMWSRLAEAGLGIMGGTSTNFAENVGKGATQAMKGYAEDVKGIRADENAKMTQLAGLGLKGAALKQEAQKLGITAKHYDDWFKAQQMQVGEMGATRRDTASLRAETATDNRIKGFADSLLKLPKYMDNPELAYADAKKMITGQSAQQTFAGFSGRPLK